MSLRKTSKGDLLRQRAESLLSNRPEVISKILPKDLKKLIHQLQVHEIELEMQNEELRKAQAEIEESRSKYFDLYDFAPVGYFTFDRKGMILEANLASATVLGVERSLLLRRPFIHFVSPESHTTFHRHMERVFSTDTKEVCELKLIKKGGNSFYISLESISSKDNEGNPIRCRSAISDVTDRKRMEEALRESEEKYRTLMEQSLQGTFVIQDMRIVFCNRTFAKMGGYTPEEIYSFSPEEVRNLIHLDDQERIWGRFGERLEGKPLPPTHNDLRAFRKDGSIAWVEYDALRINYMGRPAVQVSIVDITKRRQAEEEREKLIHSLQDALAKIRRLHGMLPICASCKKIRDDKGYRSQLEVYIEEHSEAEFTHGLCPDCMKRLYGISSDEDDNFRKE